MTQSCLSVPLALGFSICTDPATKMFLPFPAYLISSLWLRRFKSSVGSSRGSTTGTNFPEDVRLVPGLADVTLVCPVVGAVVDDEGQYSYATIATAVTPKIASAMTWTLFSIPSFTQAPDRRELSIVIFSLTGPALSPTRS